jgi:hypothetical protein
MALSSMKGNGPGKKLHPQIQEKIEYIASPIYRRRLIGLGQPEETADKLIADRIKALKNTKLAYNSMDLPSSALALTDTQANNNPIIKMRNPDNPKYASGSALAHEIGHVTSSIHPVSGWFSGFNYNPVTDEGGFNYAKSKKLFNDIIGSGDATSMSPKERLFFDLQNKGANYVAPKGSRIFEKTGGTTLNNYYYNTNKNSAENWPLGTRVDLSEQKNQVVLADLKNNINPVLYKKTLPSLNLMKSPLYSQEFLSQPRQIYIDQQGIPDKSLNPSGDPFQPGFLSHTYSAFENKADLDAVRHLFKKYGYTQKFGDDITPELFQKASKDNRINSDEQFKRMRENFDDKVIIDLNNRVAYENKSPLEAMRNTDYLS